MFSNQSDQWSKGEVMFYFSTEEEARKFADKRTSYHFIDFGEDAEEKRRYAVRVLAEA